jgi:hypothetical protein
LVKAARAEICPCAVWRLIAAAGPHCSKRDRIFRLPQIGRARLLHGCAVGLSGPANLPRGAQTYGSMKPQNRQCTRRRPW